MGEGEAVNRIGSDQFEPPTHTLRGVQSVSPRPGHMLYRRITLRTWIEHGAVQRVGVQVSPPPDSSVSNSQHLRASNRRQIRDPEI